MVQTFQTHVSKDIKNKKLKVTREFDGSPDMVWRAWTEPELLDQWWAPKPWKAVTKSMNFKDGGSWLYAMTGLDGQAHWCKVEYSAIKKNNSFKSVDTFCDESGKRNPDMPEMIWNVTFHPSEVGTKVEVELSFKEEKDMQQILDMGFEEGFTMALGNLDDLLIK